METTKIAGQKYQVSVDCSDAIKKMEEVEVRAKALSKAMDELNEKGIDIKINTIDANKKWWQFWK